jgi:hypothetical protein
MYGMRNDFFCTGVRVSEKIFEGRDYVAGDIFGSIMKESGESPFFFDPRFFFPNEVVDPHAVLGDGVGIIAGCLSVPSCDSRESEGDIGRFDIGEGWF